MNKENKSFLTLIGGVLIVLAVGCFALAHLETKRMEEISDRHVDWPEEWEAVKEGDTLKVYKIANDTIFVGFYNQANREDRIYLKK